MDEWTRAHITHIQVAETIDRSIDQVLLQIEKMSRFPPSSDRHGRRHYYYPCISFHDSCHLPPPLS